jgi:glycosyltransferase involved in cell wall biosynthesis
MDPLDVSVIIPTYHREQQLLEALRSVLSQSGITFEVIVVDDSADASARSAVASLGDPRIRYLARPEPSKGRPALVRNDGAQLAQGRYLYFLDDDDILEEGTLATMSKALDAAPEAGMAFGVITPFGLDAAILQHNQGYFTEARRVALKLKGRRRLSAYLTFRSAVLVCSAGMARRSAFVQIGGFDPDIPVCEDVELWARIVRANGHVFIDKAVVRYRTGAPSLMHNLVENDEKLRIASHRIHKKYRQTNGLMEFIAMKLWARAIFR